MLSVYITFHFLFSILNLYFYCVISDNENEDHNLCPPATEYVIEGKYEYKISQAQFK